MGKPLRVLMVHNMYRSHAPSGENQAVLSDVNLLRAAGVAVETYFPTSDHIPDLPFPQRIALPIGAIRNQAGIQAVTSIIESFRPHIMHLHNVYPLISPPVIGASLAHGVAIVQTVHNQRHNCPAGTYFRDGHICQECRGLAIPHPSIVHGCYRGSRLQSAVMCASLSVNRRHWKRVHRFLVLSQFASAELQLQGIDRARISLRPTFVPFDGVSDTASSLPRRGLLYVGRLDEEKGVGLLLDAWQRLPASPRDRLTIVGDGALREQVLSVQANDGRVAFKGVLDAVAIRTLLREHVALVVPSLCHEGFPRVVVEAFATGTPVVATDIGSLREIVGEDRGWLTVATAGALAECLKSISEEAASKRGEHALLYYMKDLNPQRSLGRLIQAYESAITQLHTDNHA